MHINTKLVFCPTNDWFVSSIHSPSCDAVRKWMSNLLAEMPGFKSAIDEGLRSARLCVAASVKVVDNVNVDHRPSLVCIVFVRVEKTMTNEKDYYDNLQAFHNLFAGEKPRVEGLLSA